MNTMLSEIFFDTSILFIIIGSGVGLALGLALIIAPSATLKFNEKINTRISMREKTKTIEKSIKSEPFFYKHSKISGAILVIGSLFVIYTLETFNAYSLIPHLPKSISAPAWEWIIQSAEIFLFISCVFILVFGLIVFIRPSMVKSFEEVANHWISTRQGFSKMSTDIDVTNKLVNTYPRAFGFFISLFSLIVLFLLLPQV